MDQGYLNLETLWFALIGVLWIGYFFLEGFDFGVGMLLPVVSRDELDRRAVLRTIGPVWDGNEVWLLVAGGATFAAFPEWYATLFSGFYLPLFLVLGGLIVRGVGLEYRNKRPDATWRARWDLAITAGSAVPALLWGVAWANILQGVPIDADRQYTAGLFNLLNPYALVGGLALLGLFLLHGAVFLTLKTEGELAERAAHVAKRIALPAAGLLLAFLAWTYENALDIDNQGEVPGVVPVAAVLVVLAVEWLLRERWHGWAFVATGLGIVLTTATVFLNLYPRVMPSSTDPAYDLTIWNAASTNTTLKVMTVVALVMTPIVLAYQMWSFWIFRKRVTRADVAHPPVEGPLGEPTAAGAG